MSDPCLAPRLPARPFPAPRHAVLAQLAHPLGNRNPMFCNKENVPLAAGYLAAMARKRGLDRELQISILEPDLADRAGDALLVETLAARRTDLLALSLYPWNYDRSLWLGAALRARRPGLLTIAGGPEVNANTIPRLLGQGHLDLAVHGEGEEVFPDVLAALLAGSDPAEVAGVSALRDGQLRTTPARPTLRDLDRIPSPYLDSTLDANHWRQVHILFERGCVYACKYCHWWPDKRSKGAFSLARIEAELRHLRATRVEEIIFLDASINTSQAFPDLCALLERENADRRFRIKLQVLYDHFTREQLEAMARAGVSRLEIGLQSATPEALRRAQRPTEIESFERALALADGLDLELQVDFMLGLPGETVDSVERSAAFVKEAVRGHRVAQISPFLLSVGPATRFHREAAAEGLRFQQGPPFRVLSTATIDYAALRDLRRRTPQLLGGAEHRFWDLDDRHYALNLFEPDLYSYSSAAPGAGGNGRGRDAAASDPTQIDAIHIRCSDEGRGHEHAFEPGAVAPRLAQIAQVWLSSEDGSACLDHLGSTLAALSGPNPYTVWDVVLESAAEIDLDACARALAAIRFRINNVDWDNHLVNAEEGAGWARLATRPLLVLPLGAVSRSWLEQAALRFPVVHAIEVDSASAVREQFALARSLPGEGVLVDIRTRDAVVPALEEMTRLETRVRGFRNAAIKALFEGEQARIAGQPRPRFPWRDRHLLRVGADGSSHPLAIGHRLTLADLTALAMTLPRRAAATAGSAARVC